MFYADIGISKYCYPEIVIAAIDVNYKDDGAAVVGAVVFSDYSDSIRILRGKSYQPLYINAAGQDPNAVAGLIMSMNGIYRIPTLLKQADSICRQASRYHGLIES